MRRFFSRVDMRGNNPAVGQGMQFAVQILPDMAQTEFLIRYGASVMA